MYSPIIYFIQLKGTLLEGPVLLYLADKIYVSGICARPPTHYVKDSVLALSIPRTDS